MSLIERTPDVLGGAARVRGTRVYAHSVAAMLCAGQTYAECRDTFPTLPELTEAELAALRSYPSPLWVMNVGGAPVWIDGRHGDLYIADPDDGCAARVAWEHREALIAALSAAQDAHQQWQRDVAAWEATQPAAPEGTEAE